ncbi:glycosyl hydrolase 53 family protein [Enterococcus sp. 5H]|uniref:glycosyl hydrolase 53 family protein n=1 Tax=Enterococcus sp. 5H TaxID=1229490 RepID=UPI0023045016|nr:glycosyl hydrolase 53 family protein [Enterococcus sp. 5H]
MKKLKLLTALGLTLGVCAVFATIGTSSTFAAETDDFYVEKVDGMPADFIKGVDISTVIAQEQSGVKYYDENGGEKDLFLILKENGVNYVRIRVWNDPYNADGQGYGAGNCDVPKAIEIGKRATKAGMRVLIDFHYSDFWADPGRQIAPKAWTGFTVDQKAEALYNFTKDSLQQMKAAGVDVSMVQVGNETTGSGVAGESGNGRYTLFKAGSKAIREVDPSILIALHFTNPEKTSTILNYAKTLKDNSVDYDVFATSYYAFWHGSLDNLTNVLKTVSSTYGKKTIIAETSYAYTLADGDGQKNVVNSASQITAGGYPASVQGQANSLRDVMNATVKAGDSALGIFYWEPAWTPVGAADREANLPIWEQFGSGWASTAAIGYDTAVNATNYGGSEWDNQALFDFSGKALDSLKVFKYAQTGYNEAPVEENLLKNGSFETADLSDYLISQPYVTRKADTPKIGTNALHFWNKDAVDFTVEQKVSLAPGHYRFNLFIQGDETGTSEDIYAYAKVNGSIIKSSSKLKLQGLANWQEGLVEFTLTEAAEVNLGLSVKGDAGAWGTTDSWSLVTTENPPAVVEAESVKLNASTLSILKVNGTLNLDPQVLPENTTNKNLSWQVDKPEIAEVNAAGILTAKKAGTARVTSTTNNGKTATFTIRVTK